MLKVLKWSVDIKPPLKAMCHTDVVAPIVTNRFLYFRRTSSFFDSKPLIRTTITRFALSRKTNRFDENRETDWLQWELQRRYDTSP